ncbi:hypothetical protein O7598_15525 [Micromonospora sp. WMMC241]|uniref:hypothetical protein n=1 Tax=Micromonospora sp. WMMC241 TaxID=3015159 RepID=UPI0022B7067B|nr:hypothetical protein [Micromonospora sp. WMMC241]MCZ7437818.1 hypothetical protein [Micromonospora sp. WMMC241]
MRRTRSEHDVPYRTPVQISLAIVEEDPRSLRERRLEMGHSAIFGRYTAPDRSLAAPRWGERGLGCAAALLPPDVRHRYVEEWRDGLQAVLREQGSRRRWADELVQCLRAAVSLAIVLRLRQ